MSDSIEHRIRRVLSHYKRLSGLSDAEVAQRLDITGAPPTTGRERAAFLAKVRDALGDLRDGEDAGRLRAMVADLLSERDP